MGGEGGFHSRKRTRDTKVHFLLEWMEINSLIIEFQREIAKEVMLDQVIQIPVFSFSDWLAVWPVTLVVYRVF